VTVTLVELQLGGTAAPWERLGFATAGDLLRIGAVTLRYTGSEPAGISGWTLAGVSPDADLDGLPTRPAGEAEEPAAPPAHPNGALRLDHVVVFSPALDRTFAALEAAGFDLRRTRDAGTPEHPLRQGFYRLGEVILEVVGDVDPPGSARFWGLVVIVEDLDELAARFGQDIGAARDAVQPGRRIATVRESAGLGLPVAFMSPQKERR
jgi:hypothetical protein